MKTLQVFFIITVLLFACRGDGDYSNTGSHKVVYFTDLIVVENKDTIIVREKILVLRHKNAIEKGTKRLKSIRKKYMKRIEKGEIVGYRILNQHGVIVEQNKS